MTLASPSAALPAPQSLLSRLRLFMPVRWAKRAVRWSTDAVYEWRLGVRTGGSSLATHAVGGVHSDSNWYEPIDYIKLNRCLAALDLGPDDVVFDIGCGLGRVLCVLARQPIRKSIGLDLDEAFVEAARRNVAAVRGRRSPVEVLVADAANADYSEGTVFYLYNSFGATTMRAVLDRIHASVIDRPRPIRIIYVNPMQNHVFEATPWLDRRPDVTSPWYEMRATVWAYDPAAQAAQR